MITWWFCTDLWRVSTENQPTALIHDRFGLKTFKQHCSQKLDVFKASWEVSLKPHCKSLLNTNRNSYNVSAVVQYTSQHVFFNGLNIIKLTHLLWVSNLWLSWMHLKSIFGLDYFWREDFVATPVKGPLQCGYGWIIVIILIPPHKTKKLISRIKILLRYLYWIANAIYFLS